jgi:hypothetical protein
VFLSLFLSLALSLSHSLSVNSGERKVEGDLGAFVEFGGGFTDISVV